MKQNIRLAVTENADAIHKIHTKAATLLVHHLTLKSKLRRGYKTERLKFTIMPYTKRKLSFMI